MKPLALLVWAVLAASVMIVVLASPAQATVQAGTPLAWGDNAFGQLGDRTTTQRNTPTQLSGFSDVQTIAGGFYHSLALKSDGVWAWGRNDYGQLGTGTTTDSNTPVQVKGPNGEGFLSGVQAIDGGFYHSLALKSDGTVWAWGSNKYRQLGDGTTTNSSTPVQVSGLSDVKAISSGGHHGLALKSDDTLWAWGKNEFGELGDGTTTNSSKPLQVLTDVQAIAGGQVYSLALKNDGTLWAWGRNNWGQLGDGTTTQRNTPVKVLTDVQAIAAGHYHSLALKNDGTLWSWGRNDYGQLGIGTTTDSNTPVQVSGFSDEQAIIAAGYYHNLALKSDSTLWTWGRNEYGQLGTGTTTQRNFPVQVSSLSGAQAIDGGGNHSLAVTSSDTTPPPGDTTDPQITITTPPQGATYTLGQSVAASYSCTDADSGVASCQGPVTNGANIDTSSSGTKTFSVVATDNVGNTNSVSHTYTVNDPTTPGGDTTPPTVVSTVPGSGAMGVSPSINNVKATFSEAMDASTTDGDPSTITTTTFMLFTNGSTTKVAAKVSYDSSTRTAKLNPNNNLRRGLTYRAVLTTGVQDVAGNPLAQQIEWLFTVKR